MFTVALFAIVKKWNQPGCPLTGEWINTFWYLQYNGTLKNNNIKELLIYTTTWINLKQLCWVNKARQNTVLLYDSIQNSRKCKITESRSVCVLWRREGQEWAWISCHLVYKLEQNSEVIYAGCKTQRGLPSTMLFF